MAALVCDVCGGKLIIAAGGIAVCDSCDTVHNKDRLQEKIQEIKGTVRVDNSHMVDTWMKLGASAASAGNHMEAYNYFTRVVELDLDNWRAIFEKGKAAARQTTLDNQREQELWQAVRDSMQIVEKLDMEKREKVEIINEFAVALQEINSAVTGLMFDNLYNLERLYYEPHYKQILQLNQRWITSIDKTEEAMLLIQDFNDDLSKQNVINMKKAICSNLICLSIPVAFYLDFSQESLHYIGYSAKEKEIFIEKYDLLIDDIHTVDPKYNEMFEPDPFDPPDTDVEARCHQEKLKKYYSEKRRTRTEGKID